MNNYYSFFNKIIKSSLNISPLPVSKSRNHDIEVTEIHKKKILIEAITPIDVNSNDNLDFIDFGQSDNYFVINFKNLSTFYISKDFTTVEYHKKPETDHNTLRHLIIDQVIPRLINDKNSFIIHCSSVKIEDKAVLLIGKTGSGKSTLAASFMMQNYKLLTDDIVCIQKNSDNNFFAHPSYPGLRVWPNTLKYLNILDLTQNKVSIINNKTLLVDNNYNYFENKPIKIDSIYILNPSDNDTKAKIEELKQIEAFELITKSIFRLEMFRKDMANEFKLLSELLKKTNIYSLNYTKNFDSLGNMIDLIVSNNNK